MLGLGFSLWDVAIGGVAGGVAPGAISDFSSGYINAADPDGPLINPQPLLGDALIFEWTAATDEFDAEAQISPTGEDDWTTVPLDLLEEYLTSLEDATIYDAQVRAISGTGRRGLWSNVDTFQTFTVGWVEVDRRVFSIASATEPASLNLDAVGVAANEVLVRNVGNLIIIWAGASHGVIASQQITKGPATGYSDLAFAANAAGSVQHSVHVVDKICDGTEGIVDLFDRLIGTNTTNRLTGVVMSFAPTGVPVVHAATAEAIANPLVKTIPCAGQGVGVFVWCYSFASPGNSPVPDPVMVGVTPSIDIAVSGQASGALNNGRLQGHIFPFGTAPVDVNVDPVDAGNNGTLWGFHKVELP